MAFQFAALAPFIKPMLMGAGMGALGGLLTGNDPLKGALIGGATSGLLSTVPAGSFNFGQAGVQGANQAAGTGVALADVAGSSALPSSLGGSNLAGGIGSNVGTGTGIQLANSGADMFNPVPMASGGSGIDNLSQYATGAGTDIMAKTPSMYDELSPYFNVTNMMGAKAIANQFPQRPPTPIQAGGGGVTRGQAPQDNAIQALIQSARIPERRRLSLL